MNCDFNPAYLALLRQFEGLFFNPYVCPAGKCTIGYGTNLEAHPRFIPYPDVRSLVERGRLRGAGLRNVLRERGMKWSAEEADKAMVWELEQVHEDLMKRCRAYAVLRAKGEGVRADALLDMGYNMGVGRAPDKGRGIRGTGLLSFTATLPMLERGEYQRAAENLTHSAWYRQVGRRSRAVCSMIATGRYPESLR